MGVVPIDGLGNWSMSLHLSFFINHCYITHLAFYLWFHSCIVWWDGVAMRATAVLCGGTMWQWEPQLGTLC